MPASRRSPGSGWLRSLNGWHFLGIESAAQAKVFASQKQALAEAFPDASRIERRTLLLRAHQVEQIEARSGRENDAKIVVIHVAYHGDKILGIAEIAVHVVRTQP